MKKAVIYGATSTGKMVYEKVKHKYNILYFVDGNPSLIGSTVEKIPVKDPEIILLDQPDIVVMGILTGYEEAVEYLVEKGYPEENILCQYVDLNSCARKECLEKIAVIFENMKILAELFMTFFKIGLFTFGGGYAMLPLLQAELARKKKWVTDEELMDYYCIGQSTPGIISVNVATFIGYKKAQSLGAVVATMGIIAPSQVIIMSLAHILNLYMDNPYVSHAFAGIRIVVVALIAEAVLGLWKKAITDKWGWGVFIVSLGLVLGLNASPILLVVLAAALGLGLNYVRSRK